ncbi:hypothetical protein [Tardiphaga sp. P9-11]|jgi:hypothetical protein|uniref:hypothetical protein n=1 Tax=Tardiphaga sp. P9-11 TaxID=2024614 RepID=UPI0011F1808E|nr:hypothetical protein [Tardiphaga sp. P9-11]KAA0074438.1 hypothetical protein CIW50_16015 [Tardiphaga sp. P9-11]
MGQMDWTSEAEPSTFTRTSLEYRRKASALSQRASMENDPRKVRALLQLAISWIQVAENEELMASEYRTTSHMYPL